MMRRWILAAMAGLALAACGGGEPTVRYAGVQSQPSEKIGIRYQSVSVREVSLPTYASSEFLVTEAADGTLIEAPETLWADDPTRDMTLTFARALTAITGARVAPDPWPFRSLPEVTVDIRVDRFVAEAGGAFVATGQYFVAPEAEDQPERSRGFRISVPYRIEGGVQAVATARARAVVVLAEHVARYGLR